MAAKQQKDHGRVRGTCCFPTPQSPYFHVRLGFSLEGDGRYQIQSVKVNGQRVRDFAAYHNFSFQKDQLLKPGGMSELVVRWDWKPRERCEVEVSGE
jgi:hypothetical protein